jgi:hypothetical protein
MLNLTEEDYRAVNTCILHWITDILDPQIAGQTIKRSVDDFHELFWSGTGDAVNCFSDCCELCLLYENDACQKCPYYLNYKIPCHAQENDKIGHWKLFFANPNIETTRGMIKSLEDIIR